MTKTLRSALATSALAILFAGPAAAGVVSTAASRVAIGANDSVEWGAPAADGSFVTSPYGRTSTGGVDVTASFAGGGFGIFSQGGGGGYTANYAAGDMLLDTFFQEGTVTLEFSSAIRGVGFNIAADAGGAFTGFMSFYGAGNVLFDTLSVSGLTSQANDGSAIFLGGMSSLRDITRVDIWVTTSSTADFSINSLSLLTSDPGGTSLPEPASLGLAGLAFASAALARRRRKTAD